MVIFLSARGVHVLQSTILWNNNPVPGEEAPPATRGIENFALLANMRGI